MNSDAISTATQSAMANTAHHIGRSALIRTSLRLVFVLIEGSLT
jgi:hypothetical protein